MASEHRRTSHRRRRRHRFHRRHRRRAGSAHPPTRPRARPLRPPVMRRPVTDIRSSPGPTPNPARTHSRRSSRGRTPSPVRTPSPARTVSSPHTVSSPDTGPGTAIRARRSIPAARVPLRLLPVVPRVPSRAYLPWSSAPPWPRCSSSAGRSGPSAAGAATTARSRSPRTARAGRPPPPPIRSTPVTAAATVAGTPRTSTRAARPVRRRCSGTSRHPTPPVPAPTPPACGSPTRRR